MLNLYGASACFVNIDQGGTGDSGINFKYQGSTEWTIHNEGTGASSLFQIKSDDSGDVVTVNQDGNVGIGVTDPNDSRLQIRDTGGGFTHERVHNGNFYSTGFDGTDAYLTHFTGAGMTIGYGETTGGAPTVTNLRLLTDGKVGVGRIPTSYPLEIEGNVYATTGYLTANNQQIGWRNAADSANNDWILNSSDVMQYRSGGSPLLSIKDDGNVGIGTDSPNTELEVEGGGDIVTINSTSSYAGLSFEETTGGSTASRFSLRTMDGTNGLKFYDSGASAERMRIDWTGDCHWYNTSGTAKMTWDASADSLGIGTTSPSRPLHVAHGDTGTLAGIAVENTSSGDASIWFRETTSQWAIGLDNDDDNKFKFAASNELGSSDRLTITTDGNVGIGTASPRTGITQSKLDVAGTAILGHADDGRSLEIYSPGTRIVTIAPTSSEAVNELRIAQAGWTGDYTSFYAGSSEALRISSDGAFGLSGANYGTSGQVLTSAGDSAVPTWEDVGGMTVVPINSGTSSTISSSTASSDILVKVTSFDPGGDYTLTIPRPSEVAAGRRFHIWMGGLTSYSNSFIVHTGNTGDTFYLGDEIYAGTSASSAIRAGGSDEIIILELFSDGSSSWYECGYTGTDDWWGEDL